MSKASVHLAAIAAVAACCGVLPGAEPAATLQPVYDSLPADRAAEAMTLPEGFRATVFAAEPDVKQPIAMTIDDRGRLWVAEGYSYPKKAPEGQGEDRILIFEDTDSDGKFDVRKVFIEGLNLVSGLEVGFGGLWVGQAPYLLFIPDRNGDDEPDSAPEILLDGWHDEDTHETLNSFLWGPDGWLYGCHGVFTYSLVGKPGTPEEERIPLNAAIWRYHPTRHVFEVFAHGTSNPWGVDFNDYGQSFLTCCVIPHLFHVTQGGRYFRQAGQHFNPYTYDDIRTIAVHRHWAGNQWNDADRARSDELGGGHAHSGAMIYLGDSWPQEFRERLVMNNIHGARLNVDLLSRKGSGYQGNHAPDFLLANDRSSQLLYFRYGPDGQVYMIDWYDTNQCHHGELDRHDRTNGRIFKISYKNAKPVRVDLQRLSSQKLVELQLHPNDWYVRQARRILQERGPDPAVHKQLAEMATTHADDRRRLRALWALHVTGGLTDGLVRAALQDKSEYVRGWTIQLAMESREPKPNLLASFARMAAEEKSQLVRLYLASALQRLPPDDRWDILAGLLTHPEDDGDHNLPLMYWYALEPLCPQDMNRALELAKTSRVSIIQPFVLRRLADMDSPDALAFLVRSLGDETEAPGQMAFLGAINQALRGQRSMPMPERWSSVAATLRKSESADVRSRTRTLAIIFGDSKAVLEARQVLSDNRAPVSERRAALESLLDARAPELSKPLLTLIANPELRRDALRGLAAYDDAGTPPAILAEFSGFTLDEKRDALNTLASRPEFARELLAAIEQKQLAATDVSADVIRQLGNLHDAGIDERIGQVWGIVRASPADKQKLIKQYSRMIRDEDATPDVHLGRAVFAKHCQQCHKLFGTGGSVGPELTGSNRGDLDYILSNVIDPSAVMAKDYQPAVIVTNDGRTVTGIVKEQNGSVLTVVTANETVLVPRDEIDEMKQSESSMMPDNLWQPLQPREICSLVEYLKGPQQVAMLATADNVGTFFNGKDLAGWSGDRNLWSVENGEIVGRSPGLEHNAYLASELMVGDFELSLSVKLSPDSGNSGVQFRSESIAGGEMRGYQADIGAGWWGKLYEENGRALLWKESGEKFVHRNDWNEYRIVATGSGIRTFINGHSCVDLKDPPGALRGLIAVQMHSGDPLEVRFKDLKLRLIAEGKEVAETAAPVGQ